jgi:16S rRNA processing protein RimM
VVDLLHYPAQDVLVVRTPDQRRVMLPFVEELVPEVGLDEGVVLADPPGGLFEERAEDESEQGRS